MLFILEIICENAQRLSCTHIVYRLRQHSGLRKSEQRVTRQHAHLKSLTLSTFLAHIYTALAVSCKGK